MEIRNRAAIAAHQPLKKMLPLPATKRLLIAVACSMGMAPQADAGAAYLFDIATGELITTLTPDNPADAHTFGATVAIHGNRAAVGTLDQPAITRPGNAFLFDLETGTQIASLRTPEIPFRSSFPSSMTIDERSLWISAPSLQVSHQHHGEVFQFDRHTGSPQGSLRPQNPHGRGNFGAAPAVSASRIAVGASSDSAAGTNGGAIYIFDRTSSEQLIKLLPQTPNDGEKFGASSALLDDIIVVGAPTAQNEGGARTGAVYVFNTDEPTPSRRIALSDSEGGARFGGSVAANSDFIAVGAPGSTTTNPHGVGQIYIYDTQSGANLGKIEPPIAAHGLGFGSKVDISGNFLVASAPATDLINQDALGQGQVFVYDLKTFTLVSTLQSPAIDGRTFGYSLAVHQGTLIVGQPIPETQTSLLLLCSLVGYCLQRSRPRC